MNDKKETSADGRLSSSRQRLDGRLAAYNTPAPRYTSYPPANYFEDFTEEDYLRAVAESDLEDNHISFYIHIPFCRHLCHYCGCNSYAMQSDEAVERYIRAVHQEIDLLLPHLNDKRKVSQIHYGGGSPTSIPLHHLREINEHLLSRHATIERPEIAVECHPGYLYANDWQTLIDAGFNRMSIGVQDLDESVLKLVNRYPSAMPLEEIFSILRATGISINLDYLYGLPAQTPESFARSIAHAVELRPDRLVTFSYGHVPWVHKRQLILEKAGLPADGDKQQMAVRAAEILHAAGYCSIGIDHFVLPDDELNTALITHQLHRNFQGYCTLRTTGQVYALGVTGISQLSTAYAQNGRDINAYCERLENGQLYIQRGYRLTERDRIVREVVESLMCNYQADWAHLASHLRISIEQLRSTLHWDEVRLRQMQADGLLTLTPDRLTMSTVGSPFVRNVVASLDPLMVNTTKQFSKPI